jgi:phytanoyl-CoA hydroxylase
MNQYLSIAMTVLFVPFSIGAMPPVHLTQQMHDAFERDGFVIIEDFLTLQQCAELKAEALRIVDGFDEKKHASVFSTKNGHAQMQKDAYFFDSVDKVHCFLEDDVLVDGELVVEKHRAVNKIGHALHDKNPIFEAITFSPSIVQYAVDLGITDPIVLQSMFIFKSAGTGGPVPPHQDATFLYTDPVSVHGFWIALDDATRDNGCMWAMPGSHTRPVDVRFVADEHKKLSFTECFDALAWDETVAVPLEAKKGSLIIFSGKLVHKSHPNRSSTDRNAYTFHVISGDAHYPTDNWLQRPDAPRLRVADTNSRACAYRIELFSGDSFKEYIPFIARMRCEAYREYPYLYEGTLAQEEAYLTWLSRLKHTGIAIAFFNNTPIGFLSGTSLLDFDEHFSGAAALFNKEGLDAATYYYFTDVIIEPEHQGNGLSKKLFDLFESHSHLLGYTNACFVTEAHERHPLKPTDYRDLSPLWTRFGYKKSSMYSVISWDTIGVGGLSTQQEHQLQYWIKRY